jgi:hypothetical protein
LNMRAHTILLAAVAVLALGACADVRSPTTGLLPGEIHPGQGVPFADAPIGASIQADDGTRLERTAGGWIVSTPYGATPALNPIWWTDPTPASSGLRPMEPAAEISAKFRAFSTLTPGAQIQIREEATNNPAGSLATLTVLGVEHVQVPAGEFEAVHIRRFDVSQCFSCGAAAAFNLMQDYWFVPRVGVVKLERKMVSGMYAGTHAGWQAVKIN